MGKKSTPAAPEPVDPREVAQADAEFNRIDQYTPYGSLTYSGPNRNVATLNLSPEMQSILSGRMSVDQGMLDAALSRIGDLTPAPLDLEGFGPIQADAGLSRFDPTGLTELPGDVGEFRNRIEDNYFERASRLLDPQFARQEEALRGTLANQGLPTTSDAFLDQYSQFNTDRGNTYGNLANEAVMFGGQEASRLLADALSQRGQQFNEQFSQTAFNNQTAQATMQNANAARVQALQETLGLRGNQFNELASLLGLQQVATPQMQNFFGPAAVDYMGAQALNAQQQQNAYQGALQQQQAAMEGTYGLLGAGITAAGAGQGGLPGFIGSFKT